MSVVSGGHAPACDAATLAGGPGTVTLERFRGTAWVQNCGASSCVRCRKDLATSEHVDNEPQRRVAFVGIYQLSDGGRRAFGEETGSAR